MPNGVVTNNNLVWRPVTFPALTTTRIRVLVQRAADGWSRLTEVEAYQSDGAPPPPGNTPPTVNITAPAEGATAVAPASFTVSANAGDTEGPVSSVAFYQNGNLIAQDNSSPFSVRLEQRRGGHLYPDGRGDRLRVVSPLPRPPCTSP